jgi:hypothetical protein
VAVAAAQAPAVYPTAGHRRPSLRGRQGAAPAGADSGDRRRSFSLTDRPLVAAHGGAGSEEYCEREVDELELQGGRIYLHLEAAGATHREAIGMGKAWK